MRREETRQCGCQQDGQVSCHAFVHWYGNRGDSTSSIKNERAGQQAVSHRFFQKFGSVIFQGLMAHVVKFNPIGLNET
jgi:hypothetical protein